MKIIARRKINKPHSAAPQFAHDAVFVNHAPDVFFGFRLLIRIPDDGNSGKVFGKILALLAGFQQQFDFASQIDIRAFTVEKFFTLVRRKRDSLEEYFLDFKIFFRCHFLGLNSYKIQIYLSS